MSHFRFKRIDDDSAAVNCHKSQRKDTNIKRNCDEGADELTEKQRKINPTKKQDVNG